jgi:hypothetical protein
MGKKQNQEWEQGEEEGMKMMARRGRQQGQG